MGSRAVWLSALFALAIGAWFAAAGPDFPLDDAWIHLAYAKSLRLGEGFSYNPYDFETGASSPLWALLLALLPLSLSPLLTLRVLGVLLHALLAGLTARLATRLLPESLGPARERLGLVAGLLCASEPLLAQASVSGMEVTLTAVLLLLVVHALERDKVVVCAAWSALAVWARPEALPFVALLCAGEALRTRSVRPVLPLSAAVAAQGLWVAYDLAVSGYPFPNTKYAKAGGLHVESLAYFTRLFSSSPWFMSCAGAVALVRGLLASRSRERAFVLCLAFAWLGTVLTIALSRPLDPRVLFYQSRYFAIVSAVPCALVPLGLSGLTRKVQLVALTLLSALTFVLITSAYVELRGLEQDVAQLHTEPAKFVAESLPKDARVLVEGAGTMRYFTPRTMRIIDMLGLNDASIVHAREVSGRAYACAMVARVPTYAVAPSEQMRSLLRVWRVQLVKTFTDEHFMQVLPPRSRSMFVLKLVGLNIPCPSKR
jgi:hypothetical protein